MAFLACITAGGGVPLFVRSKGNIPQVTFICSVCRELYVYCPSRLALFLVVLSCVHFPFYQLYQLSTGDDE